MEIEKLLTFVSFALGRAGFVGGYVKKDIARTRHWIVALTAGLIVFVATNLAWLWQTHQRCVQIREISGEIIRVLGNDAKSIDQLYDDLKFENSGTVAEALVSLVKSRRVGHRIVDVRDDANLRYRARLFFVKH